VRHRKGSSRLVLARLTALPACPGAILPKIESIGADFIAWASLSVFDANLPPAQLRAIRPLLTVSARRATR
jgi:hypothetical protein